MSSGKLPSPVTSAPSLYRRHRPRSFADVVGQQHVVRTLRNALAQGKIHHAYLFVGSRGTGKTSLAKILAAALNCEQTVGALESTQSAPTSSSELSAKDASPQVQTTNDGRSNGSSHTGNDPCGVCDSCQAIANGVSLDVLEMDAASNNSVDDIRDLRERVGFAPASGRYKVYILDEAHMLTTAAWNAFLKTLEEPPPNTVFVLATTEANKVLPTVVDRCHRFDFSRPTVTELATVIRRVAEQEAIEIPDEASALIARSATGSFRDALGTLEQLLAYAGNKIDLDDALAVLGVAEVDLLFESIKVMSAGDARSGLQIVEKLASGGRDLERFFSDLEGHARALMVVGILGNVPPELKVTDEIDTRLQSQATEVSAELVTRVIDLLAAAYRAMKDGADPRTQLELLFVKTAIPESDPSVQALQTRIERLEKKGENDQVAVINTNKTGRFAGRAPAVTSDDSKQSQTNSVEASSVAEMSSVEEISSPKATASAQGAAIAIVEPVTTNLPDEAPEPPITSIENAVTPLETPTRRFESKHQSESDLDLNQLVNIWSAVKEKVKADSPLLAAVLNDSRPKSVANRTVTLVWPQSASFVKRQAEAPANTEAIAAAIHALTGERLRIECELCADTEVVKPPSLSADELVDRLISEFDAEEIPSES